MPHTPFRQDSRFGDFGRFQGGFPGAQGQQLGQLQARSFGQQPFGGGNVRPRFAQAAQGGFPPGGFPGRGGFPQGGLPPGGLFPPQGGFPQQQQLQGIPPPFFQQPGGGVRPGIPQSPPILGPGFPGGGVPQPGGELVQQNVIGKPGLELPPNIPIKPPVGTVTPPIFDPNVGLPGATPTGAQTLIPTGVKEQFGGGGVQAFPPGQTPPIVDPLGGLPPPSPGVAAPGGQPTIQDILAAIQGQAGGFDPSNAFAGLVTQTPQFEQQPQFTAQDLLGTINQPTVVPQGPQQRPGFGGFRERFGGFGGGRGRRGGRVSRVPDDFRNVNFPQQF